MPAIPVSSSSSRRRIDEAINARAIAIARAVRRAAIAGVRDVVSTYRSVALCFDPLQTRLEALTAALDRAVAEHPLVDTPRLVEVPVVYGGEAGPDLADVARVTGLTEAEVVRRHTAAVYRVFMLGFVPGFAYLGYRRRVDRRAATADAAHARA